MTVSARARVYDLAALTLIVVGAALFVLAHLGLARLHERGVVLVRYGETFGSVREWERMTWLWWAGLIVAAAGVVVAVWSAVRFRRGATETGTAGGKRGPD